ncbi:UNVERIFIED_ORG: hypothetical protein EDC92_12417 [Dietzia maris]|uniref:hypothetical protein n=1 Tax=Dietzia maris TaxID=37915 RepID=UPI0010507ABE
MAHTTFPAIFRDTSVLAPAPAHADSEVIGVDPVTGYHVLCDGHFDPATVPADVRARKATDFADYLNLLARLLRARIYDTRSASWEGDCEVLAARDLIEEFAGYIYRRDLREAEALQAELTAQREDRLAVRPLPEWRNNGPARPAIRRAAALAGIYRRQAAALAPATAAA